MFYSCTHTTSWRQWVTMGYLTFTFRTWVNRTDIEKRLGKAGEHLPRLWVWRLLLHKTLYETLVTSSTVSYIRMLISGLELTMNISSNRGYTKRQELLQVFLCRDSIQDPGLQGSSQSRLSSRHSAQLERGSLPFQSVSHSEHVFPQFHERFSALCLTLTQQIAIIYKSRTRNWCLSPRFIHVTWIHRQRPSMRQYTPMSRALRDFERELLYRHTCLLKTHSIFNVFRMWISRTAKA